MFAVDFLSEIHYIESFTHGRRFIVYSVSADMKKSMQYKMSNTIVFYVNMMSTHSFIQSMKLCNFWQLLKIEQTIINSCNKFCPDN